MPVTIRIRTGIPDELGGEDVAFVNVFERPERPGGLSVILVHLEKHTVLAPGDSFVVGGGSYRLDAIDERQGGYVVTVVRLDPEPSAPKDLGPPPEEFEIEAIPARKLVALLKAVSPAILAHLAGGSPVAVAEWATESRDATTTEWNGEQIGPITTTRHTAGFDASGPVAEATIKIDDIRYEPDVIVRQEVSAFWRTGAASAHIFLRSEKGGPMTRLHTNADNAWIVGLIDEAIGHPPP